MNYIKGFDALRAFSIILVLLSHLGLRSFLPENDYSQTRLWNVISGGTGVAIFFTLSGFLITMILIRERNKNGKINLKNFYIRRFLRLLPPLLIFYTLVVILMLSGSIKSNQVGLIYSFFYIYNYIPTVYYSAELGHTWSLALEEQFYFIWPILLSIFKKIKGISIIIFITIGSCIAGYYIFPSMGITSSYRTSTWFIPAVAPIMIGSFAALLEAHYREEWKKRFIGNKRILFLAVILFLYPLYSLDATLIFGTILRAISISVILIWIMHNQETKFVRALEFKPLQYLGKISYGVYVFQGLFLTTGPTGKMEIQHFPLNILLTLLIAIASFELVEKPVIKLKKHFVA